MSIREYLKRKKKTPFKEWNLLFPPGWSLIN